MEMKIQTFQIGHRVQHENGAFGTVSKITEDFVVIDWDGFEKVRVGGYFKKTNLARHPDRIRIVKNYTKVNL